MLQTGAEGALIGRNFGWLLGDRVFRLLVGLLINAWLVRYLGAGQLGLLSFAQSVVVITAVVSQLGLESIIVRDLVRRPADDDAILGTSLALRLLGAVGTLVLALGITAALRPSDPQALALTLICTATAFAQTLDVVEYWFQGRTEVAPAVAARALAFVVGAAMKLAAIALRAPLEVVAAILSIEYLLSSTALVAAYASRGRSPLRWRFERARARALLTDAWPLLLNSVALVISVRVDQMILTTLRGTTENGIYATAQRLTEIIYYVPVAVMATAGPVLLQSHRRDPQEYQRRLQRLFSMLALSGLAIATGVSLGAPWIVGLLFGAEFAESAGVLAIQVWSAPMIYLGMAQSNWFIAEGRQQGLMLRSAAAAVMSIGLNLWLVPTLGARGSAITMVVSQFIAVFLLNALFPSTRALLRMQCRAFLPWRRA
jgi:PST family polysaccharide transporter